MPSWLDLPYEVQELVVAELVTNFDEVQCLRNLLLVSVEVHDTLVGATQRGFAANNHIFIVLFEHIFDSAAAIRRLGSKSDISAYVYAATFKERCKLLKAIKTGRFMREITTREELAEKLWLIYLMLLDDDGKNCKQLDLAGTTKFMRDLLFDIVLNERDENEWPIETDYLQLTAACFWILADRPRVMLDSDEENKFIINTLRPICLAPHRYPTASLPAIIVFEHQIKSLPELLPNSIRTVATVPVATPSQTTYFGHVLNVVPPLLCPTALAIINNRREIRDIPLWDGFPATRAEANAREDYTGSTKAEWEEINLFRRLALGTEVPRAGEGRENLSGLPPDQAPLGSKRWEHTFNRMRGIAEIIRAPPGFGVVHTWFNSMYTPGMFSGEWLGRVCIPEWDFIARMFEIHPRPLHDIDDDPDEWFETCSWFHASWREHVDFSDELGWFDGQSIDNCYLASGIDFPTRTNVHMTDDSVLITDPTEPDAEHAVKEFITVTGPSSLPEFPHPAPKPKPTAEVLEYLQESEGWSSTGSGHSSPVPEDVEMEFEAEGVGEDVPTLDVIITGETDRKHGVAWGEHVYYGRVRKLDGLIVFVRLGLDAGIGRWVYTGYMQVANSIIGQWRVSGTDVEVGGIHGTFLIARVGPEVQIFDNSVY